MYTPRHFKVQELADPALYALLGDIALKLFDPDVLQAADWLRDRYGSCTINNWAWGGEFQWSGYRTIGSPYYSAGSMHSCGKALDLKFSKVTADEIRQDIRNMQSVPFITRIEDDVNWLHIDTKPTGLDEVYFFKG